MQWVQSIKISKDPVDAPWNAYYYKNALGEQYQSLPLQSIILSTEKSPDRNSIAVSGIAYSGGSGNAIARVEVSTDNGKNWSNAKILTEEIKKDNSKGSFGWVRWKTNVGVSLNSNHVTDVCCKATDTEGKSQVEVSPKQRGYAYNGWSKVEVA